MRTAAAQAGSQAIAFNIRAQALGGALNAFADQAGLRLLFPSDLTAGRNSPGLSGPYSREQGLSQLLAGTGLSYRFTSASTVTISGPSSQDASVDGAIQLDTINVSGGGTSAAVEAPYSTPGPVSHISQETIDRFRGSSPADIFRGTPGVMSGEARNGAGSIDVNIRGMQGMGRVAVTIDGAENGLQVYQGYQGISNRTFVDPDLLAGADIRKGSDASSRGIAGTVAMRTLGADDVVKPGEKWGVWVKSGFGTNTATPVPGDRGGYTWPKPYVSDPQPYPVPTAQASGLDRPGFLTPTSGSFSTVAALKEDKFDLLWGYAFRKQGNYFAGKNGPGAKVIDTGPQPLCYSSGFCYYPPSPISYAHVYQNGGLSSYRAGEQVLNTQLQTESYLAKATVRGDNGQSLQFGYTGYRSTSGDMLASLFGSPLAQSVQQWQENTTKVDTGTVRYRWKPDDNDLIDLKANFWTTKLNMRTPPRASVTNVKPEDFGLSIGYLPGNDSRMWGGDVSNKSHVSLNKFGSLDLEYGISYVNEDTKPTPFTDALNLGIPTRNGSREEAGYFGKIAYSPVEWLTLKGGLRYSQYSSMDRSTITNELNRNPDPSRKSDGYSPSAGIVVEPVKGTQFYVSYSSALRMPTLFESVAAYTLIPNPDIGPERSNNWEAGVNLIKDNVFAANDKAMMKFGYFNWDVKDYVARVGVSGTTVHPIYGYTYTWTGLQVQNIDRARFEGLELSARYEHNGFTAELAANKYLKVEFCPTANTCSDSTLSGDYATNQIPPEYSATLTASQKLLNDDLTVGGRVSYIGPRAIGHGAVQYGASAIIAPIDWNPYWLVDVFSEYKLSKDITLWATIENLGDRYYVDPLSLVQQPGPGRTARLGVTGKFGGSEPASFASLAGLFSPSASGKSWTGFHAGVNAAQNFAKLTGAARTLDGSTMRYSAGEAPNQKIEAFSFGAQIGYDYQFANRIVAGIAADIAKSEISGSQVTFANEGSSLPDSNNMFRQRAFEAVRKTEIDWMATVRGRLGYAFNDRLMVYATGGVAFMRQNEERTQYVGSKTNPGCCTAVDSSIAAFTESASLTRTGYVIGGGAEFALNESWSLTGEYQLARFDETEFKFPNAKAGVMIANGYGFPVTSTEANGRRIISKVDIPMLKVGLHYRF
ncbi:TonB-dependent receptor domain-containing protein [Pseudorhodoplanes sinuspersici]|nr:TonB-dependent receptor [Pseudorhodoplanes sinuspersici]RKE65931.1 hemoglobin/transferrin/lactoferrin receptor protein [Pseudorhodoplanes sinuspersici]